MDLLRQPVIARAAHLLRFSKRHPPVGAMPGTLVTAPEAIAPVIRVIVYGPHPSTARRIPAASIFCMWSPGSGCAAVERLVS